MSFKHVENGVNKSHHKKHDILVIITHLNYRERVLEDISSEIVVVGDGRLMIASFVRDIFSTTRNN